MKIYLPILFFAIVAVSFSCTGETGREDEDSITELTDSFGYNYFNLKFSKALPYCTSESEKWLRFRATNVLQEDIDILRQQAEGATCRTKDVNVISDTSATVTCEVSNFLRSDTLGRPGSITKEGLYTFHAVKRDGKWSIKMEGLPQNEMRNHD